MSDVRTPTVLRSESFKGAEGLQAPLNDLLARLQERLSAVEQRQEWVALGPLEVTLPIDAIAGSTLPVDFSPPSGFTPGVAFVLQLEPLEQVGAAAINPIGAEFTIDGGRVRLLRLTTATSTSFRYLLTIGVTRAA
jgi:hypothetical protein